jgi:hypothetical protein
MAASAIFCRVLLLVLNAAAHPHRRLLPPLRRGRLLRDNAAILMVLGASDLFHAVASHALTAAGFLIWVAGVALLLVAFHQGRLHLHVSRPSSWKQRSGPCSSQTHSCSAKLNRCQLSSRLSNILLSLPFSATTRLHHLK